jgi:hypothetical protein
VVVVEVAAHAYGLGALAREEEGWFGHRVYRKSGSREQGAGSREHAWDGVERRGGLGKQEQRQQ